MYIYSSNLNKTLHESSKVLERNLKKQLPRTTATDTLISGSTGLQKGMIGLLVFGVVIKFFIFGEKPQMVYAKFNRML